MTSVDVRPSPSERPGTVAKDESNGFFSTIFSNAANMIESISKDEKNGRFADQLAEGTSSGQKLNTSVGGGAELSNISSHSEQVTPMASNLAELFPPLSSQELSASNVHFEPIHESPVSTMGTGNLMLLHFDKKKGKRNSDASRSSVLAVGAGSDNSNRLSVSGDHDTKIVRRKSISNASAAESNDAEMLSEHGDDVSTETTEAESDQKLDQILDSATIAPASKKRNREFHHAFRKIPPTEVLVDDFSCALSKDILVQGKMYLSAHYICFNSNILGWVTNITIPLREVLQIEKKSTAVLFPNGMVIRTLHQRYVFATFLSRDVTFNVITKVWHEALLEKVNDDGVRKTKSRKGGRARSGTLDQDVTSGGISDYSEQDVSLEAVETSSPGSIDEKPEAISRRLSMKAKPKQPESNEEDSLDEIGLVESDVETLSKKDASPTGSDKDGEVSNGFKNPGPKAHAPTKSDYTKDLNDVEITDATFNAPLGVVYDLLFGESNGTYVKILENQKNFDILNDTIVGISNSNKQRDYSYIKPLSGPIGPKQTKCLITDTVKFCDFSKHVEIEQVTSTPDVPSGGSFKVKTRIYLTWGSNNNTNMYVVTTIEWSAKSWIKGAIEKGSIDGQKESMKVFVDTLNETLSSKATGAPSLKKRKKAKSIAVQPAPKAIEAPPKQLTLFEQIEKLVETIGSGSPVQIPMVSSTVTGIIILVLFSLSYTYCLTKLIGMGGHGLAIEITSQDSFTKMIKIKDRSYFVLPSSETYLSHEMNRKINEGNIWKWINDRSGGQLKAENLSQAEGSPYNEFADQEFEEVVKLAKQRIDQLYRQLDS